MDKMINKTLSSQQTSVIDHNDDSDLDQEESGWTDYLVDFEIQRLQEIQDNHSPSSSSFTNNNDSSLLLSDVGSCVDDISFYPPNFPKKLSFKNPRVNEISSLHECLRDTATSPNNSPRVTFFHQDMNPKKTDESLVSRRRGVEQDELHIDDMERDELEWDEQHMNDLEENSEKYCKA